MTRRTWLASIALGVTALAAAQSPTASNTNAPPVAIQAGLASGVWDLPDLGMNGVINGFLFRGTNLPTYHFTGSLIDTPSPCLSCIEGDIQGFLDDGFGTAPNYVVRGHYKGAFFTGAGQFHAQIFPLSGTNAIGRIDGTFADHPTNVPHQGVFHGAWFIR